MSCRSLVLDQHVATERRVLAGEKRRRNLEPLRMRIVVDSSPTSTSLTTQALDAITRASRSLTSSVQTVNVLLFGQLPQALSKHQ